MDKMIRKILIANRGEIAIRVIRTAKRLGIFTVAVFSEEDRDSLHVKMADEAWCIGKVELHDTYLNIEKIISTAVQSRVDAIHPGYGFLSENPAFVDACNAAGIIFIGPRSDVMYRMGNKIQAREFSSAAGVPVVKGFSGSTDEIIAASGSLEFPVLVKAAAGGGGKGMKVVYEKKDLHEALESASRQAKAYFGDETVYVEKFISNPRHIEIQILGDQHGNVIHLYERECSIQRRYQKIIEESPSVTLTQEVREKMGAAAVRLGNATGYTGAGTIEFLVDNDLNFYFLEMNTRIQVEHPVTEFVTGIDIVEEQIRIAEGKALSIRQEDIFQKGHAIECRIYAEDPDNDFRPSPGRMTFYEQPSGEGIRVDSFTDKPATISPAYDPMIAKLVVHADDRQEAIEKMNFALDHFIIHGIKTNIEFLKEMINNDDYRNNRISTGYCDIHLKDLVSSLENKRTQIPEILSLAAFSSYEFRQDPDASDVWRQTGFWRNVTEIPVSFSDKQLMIRLKRKGDIISIKIQNENYEVKIISINGRKINISINGNSYYAWISEDKNGNVFITSEGFTFSIKKDLFLPDEPQIIASSGENHSGEIRSPMPGKVTKIHVSEGDNVEKGTVLMIIEAMKMENSITAPFRGNIKKIHASINGRIEPDSILVELEKDDQDLH